MRLKSLIAQATGLFSVPFLMGLSPGQQVPAGAGAKNQDGKTVHLADYLGKYVLLYFYPKDDTPGCTTEAIQLRDEHATFDKLGAVVVGVSRQGEESHRDFKSKFKLPFDLLVDADGSLGKSLGIGAMPVVGWSRRQSLLIDPSGKVLRFYDDVEPSRHAKEIIADIQAAKAKVRR